MAETTTPKKRGRKAAAAGQPVKQEVVVMVPLAELHPFPDHPFQVRDDESMRETAASVKENGVIIPGLVRPREEGGYEIIAGHRRKHACELAGLTAMPVIVRDMDRDSATVVMVDSNLQRESILPSERAKAYKMKLDAIKRRAGRPSKDEQENAPNVSANFRSDDEVGQEAGVSGDTIRNYIALTQLVPELQKMVDDKKGTVESGSTSRIAMWMLDTDYDGMCIEPKQVFFPMGGKKDGWNKLAKTLKAEIDPDLIEKYAGNESLWFMAEPNTRIAVKIIDDRGIESLKVIRIGDE